MNRLTRTAVVGVGAVAAGTAGYLGLITGRLTVDLGVGRRTRSLGAIVADVDAPPEVVFATAAAPYAERRPRAFAEKVQILHRGDGMVLAAHRTPLTKGLTAVTVETVTFDPPHRIEFRLVRGPVPLVTEAFTLQPVGDGTRLTYTGELTTDLGRIGEQWGKVVSRSWLASVTASVSTIKTQSERAAQRRRPRT